jgi:hypothetical protein
LPARGGTADEKDDAPPPDGDGSQFDRRIRPALGDHCLVGKGRRPGGSEHQDALAMAMLPKEGGLFFL